MKKACLMLMVTDWTLTSLDNLHLSDSLLRDSLACLGRSWARERLPFPSRAKVVIMTPLNVGAKILSIHALCSQTRHHKNVILPTNICPHLFGPLFIGMGISKNMSNS